MSMSTPDTDTFGRDGEGGATYLARGEADVTFPPDRTALLVIDPVNDFLSEGGAGWEITKNTVRLHDVVSNLKRAIQGARERSVPVLFGPMAYTEEDYADNELHRRSGINRIMFENKMFLAGSWGADFHPNLRPRDDETVLLPHKGIDVFETDLPDRLQRLGTTHLVIAGMTANLCCESTGRHAMEEGYDVTYLSDAIGAESVPAHEAAIHLDYPLIGNAVMDVEQFLAAVDAPGDASVIAQPGDALLGKPRHDLLYTRLQ
jgi:nicotinamidase-related amidase